MSAAAARRIWAGALLVTLWGAPPARAELFTRNHPNVEAGNRAFERGDYDLALREYEEGLRALPANPELHYNRGAALLKLGRAEEAREAFEAALGGANEVLKARDYYNLGNAFAELGQKAEAVAAYRQALKLDPRLDPARHNLELMLRQQPPPPPEPQPQPRPDAGQPDGGPPDAAPPDGGSPDAGAGDGGESDDGQSNGPGDAGAGDAEEPEAEREQASPAPDAGLEPEARPSPQEQERAEPIDKQEAERILDALRRNEKHFLMQQKQRSKQREQPEKDW